MRGAGATDKSGTRFLRAVTAGAVTALITAVVIPGLAVAAESGFPFDQPLLLDTRPLPGTKRMPTLEVAANGTATVGLWCGSMTSQMIFAGDTVTIINGPKTPQPCSPQQAQGDDALLASLEQVTTWRAVPDGVEFQGAQTLRFMLSTN